MHNSPPENGCEGDLIKAQLNLHWITDTFDIFLSFIQWKSKIFFGKWGEVQRQKGFSFTQTFEDVENFLEWKSDGEFFIANVIFFFFAVFLSRMTNLILFTMACLLFGRLTRGGYWEEMGVTCDLEPHDVTVCGTKVHVKRCRGTCRSISWITMGFPYYRKYCQCCQKNPLPSWMQLWGLPSIKRVRDRIII